MHRLKIYLAIVLALIFKSSCSSYAKLAKNRDGVKSEPRILDCFNISKRVRVLVDSITTLDGYTVFLNSFQEYRAEKNAMRKGEDVEQTKEFADYSVACSKILRIMYELKLRCICCCI